MAGGGFVKVDRRMIEQFGRKPYCEGWAWLWMIAAAAWHDEQPPLRRGQLKISVRFLAAQFGWHRCKVERFLARLKAETAIETATETGETVITICNYDKFSGSKAKISAPSDAPTETKYKKKKRREEKKENSKSFDYAFEGKFVRLNQRDFSVWQRGYSSVDLVALLTTRDIWLASDRATDADRKNWFISTSNWLANKNQEARKAALPQQRDPSTLWQQALL